MSQTIAGSSVADIGGAGGRSATRGWVRVGMIGLAAAVIVVVFGKATFGGVILAAAVLVCVRYRLFASAAVAVIPLQTFGVALGPINLRISHAFIVLYLCYVLVLRRLRLPKAASLPGQRSLAAFFILAVLSLAWSMDPAGGIVYLAKLAIAVTLAAAIVLDPRPANRVTGELAWGVAASIVFVLGFQLAVVMRSGLGLGDIARPGDVLATGGAALHQIGVLVNPTFAGGRNLLAAWLSTALFVLVYMRWQPTRLGSRRRNLIILALAGATILSLIVTLSRTNWIATSVGLSAFILLSSGKGRLQGIGILLIVTVLLMWLDSMGASGLLVNRVTAVARSQDVGVTGRFALWQEGLEGFARQPMIGLGVGSASAIARKVSSGWIEVDNLHNVYLQFLTDLGLIGLVLFLVFVARSMFWGLSKVLRSRSAMRSQGAAVLAMLLALWTRSLAQGQLNDLESWLVIAFFYVVVRSIAPRSVGR